MALLKKCDTKENGRENETIFKLMNGGIKIVKVKYRSNIDINDQELLLKSKAA